jgi:hypothetical protein
MEYVSIPLSGGYNNSVSKLVSFDGPILVKKVYGDGSSRDEEVSLAHMLKKEGDALGIFATDVISHNKEERTN